jgi:hypothetical protein
MLQIKAARSGRHKQNTKHDSDGSRAPARDDRSDQQRDPDQDHQR